jgi:erythromycin esterase-like protein
LHGPAFAKLFDRFADQRIVLVGEASHNSHIGDARHTEMGIVREELNLGQLRPQCFAGPATLVSFDTHTGTVAAARDWDGAMEVMQVRPSHPDSHERLGHQARVPRFLLDLRAKGALRQR